MTYFPNNSAFHSDHQMEIPEIAPREPAVEQDEELKRSSSHTDQAIYDLNELIENLRGRTYLKEEEVQELLTTVEDIRDSVYGSIRMHGSGDLRPSRDGLGS